MPRSLTLFSCRWRQRLTRIIMLVGLPALPVGLLAATASQQGTNLTRSAYGLAALLIFVLAYLLVINEEFLHLRKSKPVMVAAGLIWILIGIACTLQGDTRSASEALRHNLLEYAELLLFLLAAMAYINTLEDRQIFNALRTWLTRRGLSLRQMFWITGLLAFLLSPISDNLTTALVMAAVVIAIGRDKPRFITLGLPKEFWPSLEKHYKPRQRRSISSSV